MKKIFNFPLLIFVLSIFFLFNPFFLASKLPIPSDTIVGLYHPFRDLYAKDYPRGIPFKNFQITDPVRQQYPWKKLSIETFKQVELPLWNPYNFSGTPHLANLQSAVFYPLNLLFFILPFSLGWSILIISQPLLAMIFMYLYLRNLRLGSPASILGSLSFAFCGFFVSWMEWGNVVSTGLWLPLILLSIDQFVQRSTYTLTTQKKLWWSFLLLFAVTVSFFAGHLQVFFYMFLLSIAYFLLRWIQFGRDRKIFFIYVLLIVVFIILTFIQWFPTLQFILASARDLDQDWHNPGWFIPWQNLTQFIVPDFFGNPSTLNYWGIWNYGEFIGYVGLFPFLFALYGMLFVRRKIVWFFSFFLFASLLFALPSLFAKVPFKFEVPFLSTSQPTRLLYLADVALSILCAFGFQWFLTNKKRMMYPLGIIGLFFVSFWGFVFFNQQFPTVMQVSIDNLAVTKNNLKLPTFLYVISVLTILSYIIFEKKIKYLRHITIIVILLVTILDLYRFSSKYLSFASEKYLFPDTKILSFLQEQKGEFRVTSNDSRVFPPNFSIMYQIQTPDGYDPLFLQRYAEFSAATLRGQPNINPPFGFNRIITIQSHNNFINLLNVKYILALGEIREKHLKKIMTEGTISLYENMNVLPRTFFVEDVIQANGKYDAINKLFMIEDTLDTYAVVEGIEEKDSLQNIASSAAKIIQYEPNRIVIMTNNQGNKFLVLTDTFYPTWHAQICLEDGSNCAETKIYLTDYTFRGIIVPSGNHRIIFYNSLL